MPKFIKYKLHYKTYRGKGKLLSINSSSKKEEGGGGEWWSASGFQKESVVHYMRAEIVKLSMFEGRLSAKLTVGKESSLKCAD